MGVYDSELDVQRLGRLGCYCGRVPSSRAPIGWRVCPLNFLYGSECEGVVYEGGKADSRAASLDPMHTLERM